MNELPRRMQFPDDTQRLVVVGPTGSGKTHVAVWHLSHRDYHLMPWVIINYKRERIIDSIPGALFIDLKEAPTRPGIYIVHPIPVEDDEAVELFLREIWKRGEIGIFIDEGLMMGQRNASYRLLLTQGRSLYCPMIVCTQRPSWIDRFTFSEGDFYQVFGMRHEDDIDALSKSIPGYAEQKPLPRFHSYYYNVAEDSLLAIGPVVKLDTIMATFDRRLSHKKIAV